MSRANITVDERATEGGSAEARRMRRSGRTPGIIYRRGGSLPFSGDTHTLELMLRKAPTIVEVALGDDKYHSVVKDQQRHPVKGHLMHLDLQAVELDQLVRVTVPIHTEGTPVGIKEGGVLSQTEREALIEARPNDIPEAIIIDVTNMDIGDTVLMSELELPAGVELIGENLDVTSAVSVSKTRLSLTTTADLPATDEEGEEGEGAAEGDAEAADGAGDAGDDAGSDE